MDANPSCIRAIPYDEGKVIIICLYMYTYGKGITPEFRQSAKEMLFEYKLEYVDLEREPPGEYVAPQSCSDRKGSFEEMADLVPKIEANLNIFESRLNVMAVQPSYQTSNSSEEAETCVTVFVLGKGRIPVGEQEFPKTLGDCGIKMNIAEGYYIPSVNPKPFIYGADPLHFGVGIGVEGCLGAGTLGAFLKDENDKRYILSCEHVIGRGGKDGEGGLAIVQPAEADSEKAMNDLHHEIKRYEKEIQQLSLKMECALDEREVKKFNDNIKKVQYSKNIAEDKMAISKSRKVATYVGGYIGNKLSDSGNLVYVDAAVAELTQEEIKNIESSFSDYGTIFGFELEEDKKNCGTIINWQEVTDDEKERVTFWKSGRETEHTDGGKLYRSEFFVKNKGFDEIKCFGEFTHCKFKPYCNSCAKKTEKKSALTDKSLLDNLGENPTCSECKENLALETRKPPWARNCFTVLRKERPFSLDNDSGSVIFDEDGRAWGMIVGQFESGFFHFTVAIPLDNAIKVLNEQLGKQFSLWCIDPSSAERYPDPSHSYVAKKTLQALTEVYSYAFNHHYFLRQSYAYF